MTSVMSVVMKTGLQRFFLFRSAKLNHVTVSNGFKIPTAGDIMSCCIEEVLQHKMRTADVIVATFAKAGNECEPINYF